MLSFHGHCSLDTLEVSHFDQRVSLWAENPPITTTRSGRDNAAALCFRALFPPKPPQLH